MAAAAYSLRKVQFGVETLPGTAVAADTELVGEALYVPTRSRWRPSLLTSARVPETLPAPIERRRGSLLRVESELDFEQIRLFLDTGLDWPTTTGSGPYTHTYLPNLDVGPAVKAATFEYERSDGSGSSEYEREFAYGTTRRLSIELAEDQTARIAAELFARAEQSSTVTAGLSPLTRTTIDTADFTVYIDGTWSNLGTTNASLGIRYAVLDLDFGLAPEYVLEDRTDLDFSRLQWGTIRGSLLLSLQHDSNAKTEVDAWRNGTRRFIRLKATSGSKSLQFDLTGFYVGTPRLERERDQEQVTLSFALQRDPTSENMLGVEVVNDLNTI